MNIYSIIYWKRKGEKLSKTICYSQEDEKEAISRFKDPNDFYHTFEEVIVLDKYKFFQYGLQRRILEDTYNAEILTKIK